MKPVHVSRHPRRFVFRRRKSREPALFRSEVRLPTGKTLREAAEDEYVHTLILKSGGVKTVVKSQGRELKEGLVPLVRQKALHESVVDTLDDLLEFDVVPPTILMEVGGGEIASVQQFVEDSVSFLTLTDIQKNRIEKNDLMKMYLLDMIVGQTDRHESNILVTGDLMPGRGPLHAHAIDNGNSFMVAYFVGDSIWGGGRGPEGLKLIRGMKIPGSIRRKIRSLTYEDFLAATAGIERDVVDAAWQRKLQVENWTHIKSGLKEQ